MFYGLVLLKFPCEFGRVKNILLRSNLENLDSGYQRRLGFPFSRLSFLILGQMTRETGTSRRKWRGWWKVWEPRNMLKWTWGGWAQPFSASTRRDAAPREEVVNLLISIKKAELRLTSRPYEPWTTWSQRSSDLPCTNPPSYPLITLISVCRLSPSCCIETKMDPHPLMSD